MPTDIKNNSSDHYLVCSYFFSDKTIEIVKTDVANLMADREKDDNYFKFIDWRKKQNEIAVLTTYAYSDILLPKKFDTVFEIENPLNYVCSNFTITQAILNGWTTVTELSQGHRHICIIQFDKNVPNIFGLLSSFDTKDNQKDNIQLGFCDMADFSEITTKLKPLKS